VLRGVILTFIYMHCAIFATAVHDFSSLQISFRRSGEMNC